MKKFYLFFLILIITSSFNFIFASNEIPADNPNIKYFGRWDMTNPAAPTHSWPGVYIYAEFEGTSIGIKTNDNFCYYNVFIDGELHSIFHGTSTSVTSYTLATGLTDGNHTFLFTLRNETNWTKFSFNGLILDDGKNLLPPQNIPDRKIEFIGDSYTCAAGNLWTDNNAAPSGDYTDVYEGFASIIARSLNAQYMVTGRSGFGILHDYAGNNSGNLPSVYDRSLVYTASPKWDFSKWQPDLIVICLGLNDYTGWNGWNQTLTQQQADEFKTKYHEFIGTVMDKNPHANILAVAANDVPFLKKNISEVVAEERSYGHSNIHYTYFLSNFTQVNGGHPDAAGHQIIASRILEAIDTIDAWTPYEDLAPPVFLDLPRSNFTNYESTYTLKVSTDTYAWVRYSKEDKPYDQMENDFTETGTRNHSTVIQCNNGETSTYYLRAKDVYGNEMDTSAVITFTTDTTKVYANWKTNNYDDSQWKTASAPFGSGTSAGITTKLSKVNTVYFRKKVNIKNNISGFEYNILFKGNDGAVVYINGKEITRINMPEDDISYSTYANSSQSNNINAVLKSSSGLDDVTLGENVIAFEVHKSSADTSNILFDSQMNDKILQSYYKLGSEWKYYDAGDMPADQINDKPTGVENTDLIPNEFSLEQNYPNPFNPSTTIKFSIPHVETLHAASLREHTSLIIYDLLGRKVATLVNEQKAPGNYEVTFDGGKLSSGIYFYVLKAGNISATKKMILIK